MIYRGIYTHMCSCTWVLCIFIHRIWFLGCGEEEGSFECDNESAQSSFVLFCSFAGWWGMEWGGAAHTLCMYVCYAFNAACAILSKQRPVWRSEQAKSAEVKTKRRYRGRLRSCERDPLHTRQAEGGHLTICSQARDCNQHKTKTREAPSKLTTH